MAGNRRGSRGSFSKEERDYERLESKLPNPDSPSGVIIGSAEVDNHPELADRLGGELTFGELEEYDI